MTFGRIVWRELVSGDAKQAAEFHAQLFGWALENGDAGGSFFRLYATPAAERSYPVASVTQRPDGTDGLPSLWLAYVHVGEDPGALDSPRRAGAGERLSEPNGRYHVHLLGDERLPLTAPLVHDGVRSPMLNAERGWLAPPPVGCFCWDQLTTRGRDLEALGERFDRLFEWKLDAAPDGEEDGGEEGGRGVFRYGGLAVAGVQVTDTDVPAHWLPFVHVESVEKTSMRAEDLGGRVLVAPRQHPGPTPRPLAGEPHDEVYAVLGEPTGGVVGIRGWAAAGSMAN